MTRILYVEDQAPLRRAVSRLLSGDHEVVLASDGREAVTLLQGQDFDAVLSDVEMPVMNGFELFKWIQSEKPDLVKKFILTSAGTNFEHQARGSRVRFLLKPCDVGVLKEAINEAVHA